MRCKAALRTSTILARMARKRSDRASAFFFSSAWPFTAPTSFALSVVKALQIDGLVP